MQQSGRKSILAMTSLANRFGLFDPLLNTARAAGLLRWGPTLSAMVHASAMRWPDRPSVIDDAGELTYRDLDGQATMLATDVRSSRPGPVGVLCRNHRGFPLAQLAIERAGRDVVLLNTALPAAQLCQIVERESIGLILADDEFHEPLQAAGLGAALRAPKVDADQRRRSGLFLRPPRPSNVIMLTSGTTGPPKGARTGIRRPGTGGMALLDALPMRMNSVSLVASPLFHAWGFAQASIALSTGSTLVVHRTFDPAATLDAINDHEVTTLAVVPVMLKRLLQAASPDLRLPTLRTVLCSGNVLSPTLANAWIDRFGPNLYNIYGSTETAIASIASSADMIAAPGTVGRPPRGVTVRILDDDDAQLGPGKLGRVFTGNDMQFDGYTDGSTKVRLGDLMATGDLGFFDENGRLFVDGREHDMIVTGGENVFPSSIEEVLEQHPQVRQAAVVGVPDDEYGQRVVAFVVAEPALDLAALEEWGRDRFAGFQRPRDYRSVKSLPMTSTGKLKRHTLV